MTTFPADTPVTTPDVGEAIVPTVASAVLPLLHVPPDVASVNVVVRPIQTLTPNKGRILAGAVLTVTTAVVKQPVESVYVLTVVPGDTPFTIPEVDPTVATESVLLVHVPPPPSLSVVVPVPQIESVPEIGDAAVFTDIRAVAEQPAPEVE